MTPEREAQMREAFEKECAGEFLMDRDSIGGYVFWQTRNAYRGFLACARALEPLVRDGERLDWMLDKDAFMVWTKRDGSILQCQAYTQDEDEEYHVLSGEHRYFNTPREAIDAAMSAALEEEKNANQ
ncbi:hypothetical protein ACI2T7_03560 [Ralstonia nicotianae]